MYFFSPSICGFFILIITGVVVPGKVISILSSIIEVFESNLNIYSKVPETSSFERKKEVLTLKSTVPSSWIKYVPQFSLFILIGPLPCGFGFTIKLADGIFHFNVIVSALPAFATSSFLLFSFSAYVILAINPEFISYVLSEVIGFFCKSVTVHEM